MLIARRHNSKVILTLLLCGAGLSGCGSGDKDAPAGDEAVNRANADAMAKVHANDTTEASAGAKTAPSRAVVSERMPYTEMGDELVYGYFVAPADMFEPLPAIIMIHEWWGLNDNIKAMADRLAAEGYIVLAVDMYGGKTAATPVEARELMLSVVEDKESANNNIRDAYKFVSATAGAPKVGSLGWCFGGNWSLNAAQLLPDELDASVIYYGQVTDDEDKLRPINTPILGLFAADDRGIKVNSVEAFGAALQRLRKQHEIHVYPGVGHAFANPTGNNYNAAVANDAWNKTLEFLDTHLSPEGT